MINKIRLLSDIHEEFGPLNLTQLETDKETILVIAGDFQVSSGPHQQERIAGLCEQFKAVVYVPGNHDYYGGTIQDVDRHWMSFGDEHSNFHYLNPGFAVIDGVRFIGGILWTDLNAGDPLIKLFAQGRMNDYRQIRILDKNEGGEPYRRKITPNDICLINKKQRESMEQWLNEPFDGATIVVTHHAPSLICTENDPRRHRHEPEMAYCYGNTGLESWFENLPIDMWFHGHIHQWQQNEINEVPIIARPRGYKNHEELAFWYDENHADKAIIEVEDGREWSFGNRCF